MRPSAKIDLRTAEPSDVPCLRRIWRACFGDEDAYIDFFLQNRFVPANSPVLTVDGQVVSQLFLLPASMRTGDSLYPADYLFAAATAPAYRKHGFMAQLLRYAASLSAQRGSAAIVLRPGSAALYRYYAAQGYRTAFAERVWSCTRDALQRAAQPAAPQDAAAVLTAFYSRTNGLVWDADALRYALAEHRTFRGTYAAAGQAFAAVSEQQAVILSSPETVGQGCRALLDLSDAPALTVTLPPDAPFGTLRDGGMIRFLGEPFPVHNAFLSFAME